MRRRSSGHTDQQTISTMVAPIIHQLILNDIPTSMIWMCVSSWEKMKRFGFEIKRWNYTAIRDFIQANYPQALGPFLQARNLAEASDIARYLIVYHYSGYYIDWDIELVSSADYYAQISDLPAGYLLIDPSNGTYASECFAAVKGEPYLKNLVDDIVEAFHTPPLPRTPQYSGPFRMRETMKKSHTGQQIVAVKDMFEFDYSEIRNPYQRAVTKPLIHYWLHTWL
ncbi:hypothetical protein HHL17_22535 [Chitinophaga sp. G-6-1-13]|uniref:Glycosyl transferase n=1 Tax=Chitinophaga fulva TaxID=2728842 RepID=A0A848GNE8_9BACT|nr:glycosyltransferase [Chitinophaga fulva]NML39996.1 hypothetical protein [Chitinophaga fulva]